MTHVFVLTGDGCIDKMTTHDQRFDWVGLGQDVAIEEVSRSFACLLGVWGIYTEPDCVGLDWMKLLRKVIVPPTTEVSRIAATLRVFPFAFAGLSFCFLIISHCWCALSFARPWLGACMNWCCCLVWSCDGRVLTADAPPLLPFGWFPVFSSFLQLLFGWMTSPSPDFVPASSSVFPRFVIDFIIRVHAHVESSS